MTAKLPAYLTRPHFPHNACLIRRDGREARVIRRRRSIKDVPPMALVDLEEKSPVWVVEADLLVTSTCEAVVSRVAEPRSHHSPSMAAERVALVNRYTHTHHENGGKGGENGLRRSDAARGALSGAARVERSQVPEPTFHFSLFTP